MRKPHPELGCCGRRRDRLIPKGNRMQFPGYGESSTCEAKPHGPTCGESFIELQMASKGVERANTLILGKDVLFGEMQTP